MACFIDPKFGRVDVSWVCQPGSAVIRLTHAFNGEPLIEFTLDSIHLWDLYSSTICEPVPVPLVGLPDLDDDRYAETPLPEPDTLPLIPPAPDDDDGPHIDDLDNPPPLRYTR